MVKITLVRVVLTQAKRVELTRGEMKSTSRRVSTGTTFHRAFLCTAPKSQSHLQTQLLTYGHRSTHAVIRSFRSRSLSISTSGPASDAWESSIDTCLQLVSKAKKFQGNISNTCKILPTLISARCLKSSRTQEKSNCQVILCTTSPKLHSLTV